MTDRIPGAPGRCKAVVAGEELQKMQAGEEFAITLRRDDQPIAGGTPYNKASVLPDDLAQKLCPEVEDPAPKDAFLALHNQKADTGKSQTGEKLTITDAANAPLLGLKIYGKDTPEGTVGESGHVTVKVGGKNIADLRKFSTNLIRTASTAATKENESKGTTISATSGNSITVTQSKWPNTSMIYHSENGTVFFGFYAPLRAGDRVTISFDYEITNNPLNASETDMAVQLNTDYQNFVSVKNGRIYESRYINAKGAASADGWNYLSFAICGTSGVISNFQIAYGSANVDYEPYQEPQTITVPTPGGLPGGNDIADEIDFAKGVLIRRITEQSENPLPEDVLAAYAKLRTYAPTTIISNDSDAKMQVHYCTENTAVPMRHSPNSRGKFLGIDTDGAVSLQPVAVYVEHTERSNGWYSRIWSDGFAELYQKDTEGETVGQDGYCQIAYDLPFSMEENCAVQVTACGNVYLHNVVIDGITLQITLAGQAGTPVSAMHISVAGNLKNGG